MLISVVCAHARLTNGMDKAAPPPMRRTSLLSNCFEIVFGLVIILFSPLLLYLFLASKQRHFDCLRLVETRLARIMNCRKFMNDMDLLRFFMMQGNKTIQTQDRFNRFGQLLRYQIAPTSQPGLAVKQPDAQRLQQRQTIIS